MKRFISDILIKPLMTEKSASLNQAKCYVFEVSAKATKNEIKDAIQKFFDVKVENVRTSIKPGKVVKRGGKVSGKRSKQKKAFITLKEGTIEFIQGV